MATKKDSDKDAKGKDAKEVKGKDGKGKEGKDGKDGKEGKDVKDTEPALVDAPIVMTEELQEELAAMTGSQRAAVLMLLLGEQQASEIIRFMNPKEVQALGALELGAFAGRAYLTPVQAMRLQRAEAEAAA